MYPAKVFPQYICILIVIIILGNTIGRVLSSSGSVFASGILAPALKQTVGGGTRRNTKLGMIFVKVGVQ